MAFVTFRAGGLSKLIFSLRTTAKNTVVCASIAHVVLAHNSAQQLSVFRIEESQAVTFQMICFFDQFVAFVLWQDVHTIRSGNEICIIHALVLYGER